MLIFTIIIIIVFSQNNVVLLENTTKFGNGISHESNVKREINNITEVQDEFLQSGNFYQQMAENSKASSPSTYEDQNINITTEIQNQSTSIANLNQTMIEFSKRSAPSTDQDQKEITTTTETQDEQMNNIVGKIPKESSASAGGNQEENNSTEVQIESKPTASSSPVPNANPKPNTAMEIQENSSTAVNLDYGITNKPGPAVICNMSSFDHLKVTPDKVSRTAYLTWDSNKTTDCDYEFKVTTKTDYPESLIESHYVTGHNYTVKDIVPCVSYNFTVELQRSSVKEVLFVLSDTLETDIPEEDKVNNVTYDVTTDSIFLNWVPSPYAQICKIKYRINVTNSIENIPYFRLEADTKHIVRYLSSCTYYNVTIQASDLRKRDETYRDPLIYVINTLPEHANNLKLNVTGNYSQLTWNPPSNRECLKGYDIYATNFNATTLDTHYETNQNLICTIITIYPITKDNRLGKPATILKPGLVQNVESYAISHEAIKIYWNPPINQTCVDGYLVKVTNHSEHFTNDTSLLVVNLTACTTYVIKLYALTKRSDYGDPYILNASTIEPAQVGTVENLISTIDDKIVTLSWDPPSNGRTCKFRYLVDVHDENKKIFRHNLTTATNLTYNFTDAIYCAQYTVSVSTLSQSAQSDENVQVVIEIPEVRTAPTCTAVNVSTTRAVLECKFEDFPKNVCPIERLTVKCNDVVRLAENLSNRTKTEVTLEGLQAYSEYACTALTNTSSGESPLSDPFDFRTQQGVPNQAQVDEIVSYTNTSFGISWKEAENIPGVFKDYRIQVDSHGATYYIPSECQRNENNTFEYEESSINRTTLQFSRALPSHRYQVSVQVATEAGYGPPSDIRSVITRGGIPEEPRNTNFTLLNLTSGEEYNVSVVINWIYPCFTNGPVSHFHVEILGKSNVGDQIEDHHVEKVVPVNDPITNLTYEYTLEHLKPAFQYHIFIKVVTEDMLESIQEELQFTSYESFPEAPTMKPILNVTKHSFTIGWDKPKETRGRLRKYVVHVDSVAPRYRIPYECAVSETKQHDTIELPDYEDTFTYKKGMPYHLYNVSLAANNRIGSSPLTESLVINTLEAEPEEVRNLHVDLEYSETEEYSALAKVHFDHPCHTYGIIQGINVSLIDHETEHQINNYYINAVSERYDKTFLGLLPERTYTIVVRVETRAYNSEGITRVFKTNAGIPLLRKQITSPVLQDSGTVTFTLSKDLFDEQNGRILYYAIILGEIDGNEKSKFGILRETEWPALEENFTTNDRVRPYQATPEYWNPFKDNNLPNVTMTLGDNSYEGNKPLVPSVTYTLKVRGYTKNGYRDSATVSFRMPSETKLGLILGLTFGIMGACVMAFAMFFVWKKRQNWSKKKESIKSIPLTPIPISISNFSQYYGDLQDNGEKLKLEFSLLASKSSEIVANFCDATLPANKKKNRYTNILPYDETRVKLMPVNEEEESESDYINASYIKGYTGNMEYIATQGPLEHTVMDFWKMVIQENSSLIVMVAQFVEQNKDKCYKYFPNVHENLELENGIGIRCCTELNFKNYVVRTFMIQTETQQWTTTHLQFTDWPDFGCPEGTEVLIEFCQLMRDHAGRNRDPIIIHCSAGVGRTGTLIALDILIQAISSKSDIDIFGTVLNLRRDRKNMVQTEKQYLFIHNCVDDVIRNPACISTADELFLKEPIYENLNGIKNEQLGCDMQESKF